MKRFSHFSKHYRACDCLKSGMSSSARPRKVDIRRSAGFLFYCKYFLFNYNR